MTKTKKRLIKIKKKPIKKKVIDFLIKEMKGVLI
jgi:hypothetical protein